jgi:hypothetical protein
VLFFKKNKRRLIIYLNGEPEILLNIKELII